MILKVINSGSDCNGYVLLDDKQALLIEAGCKPLEMKKALNWKINKVIGCIISHSHQDHSKYADKYMKMGIPVIKPYETERKEFRLGNFVIKFFDLVHDVPCYGAYIYEKSMGSLIFLTDTEYCKYSFRNMEVFYEIYRRRRTKKTFAVGLPY